MWYRPEDLGLRRFFAGSGKVDLDQLEQVASAVEESDGPVEPGALQEATGLTATKLATALNRLEDAGAVQLTASGEVIPAAMTPEPGQAGSATAVHISAGVGHPGRYRGVATASLQTTR